MKKISTNITLDPILKKESVELLKLMGLDLSTAISLFLKQMIVEQGLPFKVYVNRPNRTLLHALDEYDEMKSNPVKYKRYKTVKELAAEYE